MEAKQISAVFGVLAFLGTFAALGAAVVGLVGTKLIGEERLSRCFTIGTKWLFGGWGLARKITLAAIVVVILYSGTLLGASLASREWTLAPGVEKYFCEVDCHLAYSVTTAHSADAIGTPPRRVKPHGNFIIVSVRTRFDETTISRHRGDSPLVPSPREITLVDEAGHSYSISQAGQQALETQGQSGVSISQPLRPGESYVSQLVFDLPTDAHNSRLMIASKLNPSWFEAIVIGGENSVLHKKVFLALPTVTSH